MIPSATMNVVSTWLESHTPRRSADDGKSFGIYGEGVTLYIDSGSVTFRGGLADYGSAAHRFCVLLYVLVSYSTLYE